MCKLKVLVCSIRLWESESLTMSRNGPRSNHFGQSTVLVFLAKGTVLMTAVQTPLWFQHQEYKYDLPFFFLSVCPCTVGVALGFQIFLRYPQSYSILVARVTGGQSGCLQAQSSQMHASRSHILSLHFKPAGKKGLDFGSPRHQQIDAK